MQKIKNRKKLTASLAIFAIIFVTGAAFAADFGILQITGMVAVGAPELEVIWTDQATESLPLNSTTTNTATILGGNKVIEWAIGFSGAGTASLTATATNTRLVPAYIDGVDISTTWFDFVAETGIEYSLYKEYFTGSLLPGENAVLRMDVRWNPEAFEPFGVGEYAPQSVLELLLEYEYIISSFVVDIVYRRYMPTP